MRSRPYSEACERNREPIVAVLLRHFADRRKVLEVGSGSGQHAVHFARALPQLEWQTADRAEYLEGIRAWLDHAQLSNTPPPWLLDVNGPWPANHRFDAAFTANTLHIMSWSEVEKMFAGLASMLIDDARIVVYGPFNYGGKFTSASNAAFDAALKSQAPHMGIREFENVARLAEVFGMRLIEDHEMPANNRCLVWRYREAIRP